MAVVTGSWILDIPLLIITVVLLCHWYISSSYNYFKDRGIPFLQPWPFIGLRESWTKSQHDLSIMLYNTFPKERFFGYFQAKLPLLVVKDPDLIHRIMVKDFAHFHDQGFPYTEHDFLSKNLFNLKGESWRALRLKLIPTFTTGKLKNMFSELVRCGDQLNTEVEKCSLSGETVDSRLFSQNFTSEVIGSIAFGIDINKNSPQGIEFNTKMQQMFAFSIKSAISYFLLLTAPKIVNTLKLSVYNEESSNYFVNLVKSTKEYRKKNNIKRNDYFQLLLNIQEAEENGQNTVLADPTEEDALINQMDYAPQSSQGGEKVKLLTDECFTAQSFVFFSGGSESVSGTLGFIFYHIAKDTTIQERLVEEVKDALAKHNGWTYNAVKDMTYMDQVIQETQRMYPVISVLMRECSIPYHIPDSNVVVEKGARVIIPVAGIQMDPNNYSSPEEFNPDRFANNNHKPSPKYMPFGDGPRVCIVTWGLRLTELAGPRYPDRGQDVTLTCNFDTGDANLYSVKWYKDENEFFRYMPDNYPQMQVFPLPGIALDVSQSGMNRVKLTNVNFPSSGSYRCEVSTEAPSFETVFSNHNMTVLSYPQEEPVLSGAQDVLSAGDMVAVNCTAPPSQPAPQIHFYTNTDKAEDWLVEQGPVVVHADGTSSTSAVLRFHAERQHFLPPDGTLELRCEVSAPPLPPVSVTRHLYLDGLSANQKLAQRTLRNAGAALQSVSSLLLSSLVIPLL